MIKFERSVGRYGEPVYTAVLKGDAQLHESDLVLATIEKGEWALPKRVRYEVYLGTRQSPGYPDSYEDTLADAKDYVLGHVRKVLLAGLPKKGEPNVQEKQRAAKKVVVVK